MEDYSWIRYIKKRIENNKNFLCILTGPTGSGKSWTGLSIAEMLDPEFNSLRVVFRGIDLMKLINSNVLKKGNVILFDEAQIDLNSRNWQSLINKMLNYLITTFRHKNFILLFTSPYSDFMDSATMKLFHANFETVTISNKEKTVTIKPKLLQYNHNMKKWYRKYLKCVTKGRTSKIKRWKVPKPSEKLIEEYERAKLLFTSMLNRDIEAKMTKKIDKDKKEQEQEVRKVEIKELKPFDTLVWAEVQKGYNIQQDIVDRLNEQKLVDSKVWRQHIPSSFKRIRKSGRNPDDFKISSKKL